MAKDLNVRHFDIIVVGSGIAGLFTALKAADFASVCLLGKGEPWDTNTWLAQGGIAAALAEDDSPAQHLDDTLEAGAGLCDRQAVSVMVEEGPARVRELLDMGVTFDKDPEGLLSLTREGAHRRNRVLHAGGDATGTAISQALMQRLQDNKNITVFDNTFATNLICRDGRVYGVKTLTGTSFYGFAVVLATGGLGQVYARTTNPAPATGDGVAMAYRAGAAVADLEFVQFHPTVFSGGDAFLISEAVRGEGAVLRNRLGRRFMPGYHEMAELGPRDVVARAILSEVKKYGGTVFLDITHKSRAYLKERFPTIYTLATLRGYDMATDWLPVSPAAHYAMGGILTGLDGESSLPGLYACGETACTGVHGANRLASNSLLEGLVFAARVADAIGKKGNAAVSLGPGEQPAATAGITRYGSSDHATVKTELRNLMFEGAGVIRECKGLLALLEYLRFASPAPGLWSKQGEWELRNLFLVAELIVRGALLRQESRGAHFRTDFPATDNTFARRLILAAGREEEEVYGTVAV